MSISSKQIIQYRNGLIDMCKKFSPDYFVTLTFYNQFISENQAHSSMKSYCAMAGRELFGKRSFKRLERLVFKERNSSDGIHYHLLLRKPTRVDEDTFKNVLSTKWKKIKGYGYSTMDNNEWFKPVEDINGLSEYLLKQFSQNNEDMFVADLCFCRKNLL
jgi:hypothetical protein